MQTLQEVALVWILVLTLGSLALVAYLAPFFSFLLATTAAFAWCLWLEEHPGA